MTVLDSHPNCVPGRAQRAAVFTTLSMTLALAAHVLGGGSITVASASAVFVLVAISGWAATRRERGRPYVVALVLATQAVAHVTLGLAAMLRSGGSSGGRSDLGAGLILFCHHGTSHITAAQQRSAARGLVAPHLSVATPAPSIGSIAGSAVPMLVAHLIAALALAWWLHRGERAAWRGLRRAVLRLTATPSYRPAPIELRQRICAAALAPCVAHEHSGSLSRRGPPVSSPVSLILGRTFRFSVI